jgi:hypothetical protein
MPFNRADLDWAAEAFGDLAEDDHLDELAEQARWDDQFHGSIPAAGHCLNCGDRCDDLTFQGLCDRCDTLATDASTACINGLYGLGHRVF